MIQFNSTLQNGLQHDFDLWNNAIDKYNSNESWVDTLRFKAIAHAQKKKKKK